MVDPRAEPRPHLCVECGHPMLAGFPLCKECGSYQNWRRYFSLSSTILSLLVALFSVIGISFQNIANYFVPLRAAVIVDPSLPSQEAVQIAFTNFGDAPAVAETKLVCQAEDMFLEFDAEKTPYIKPGEALSFNYVPVSTFYVNFLRAMKARQTDLKVVELQFPDVWQCSLSVRDKIGKLANVSFERTSLHLFLDQRDRQQFMFGDFRNDQEADLQPDSMSPKPAKNNGE